MNAPATLAGRLALLATALAGGAGWAHPAAAMEDVRAATAVRIVRASWMGKLGSTPSRMWSQAHSDS